MFLFVNAPLLGEIKFTFGTKTKLIQFVLSKHHLRWM